MKKPVPASKEWNVSIQQFDDAFHHGNRFIRDMKEGEMVSPEEKPPGTHRLPLTV